MPKIIEFEGRQIEMPDDVSDEEVSQILASSAPVTSRSDQPPSPSTNVPGFWDTLKAVGSSMIPQPGKAFTDTQRASEGIGETIADAGNSVIPWLTNPGGALANKVMGRENPKVLDAETIDPYASVIAGSGAALGQVFQPVVGPLMMADRGVREAGARLGAAARGDTLSPERSAGLRRYTLEGTPSDDITEISIPDSSTGNEAIDTALNTGGRVVQDLANSPITTLGTSKAGGRVVNRALGRPNTPASLAKTKTVGTPANEAVDVLQRQLKPGKNTEAARDFEVDAPIGLKDIVAQSENVGPSKSSTPNHDRFLEMSDQARRPYGEQMGQMIDDGIARGEVYDSSGLWAKLDSEVNRPITQLFSPEFSKRIVELRERFPEQMPLNVAHELASDISAQLRRMDNQIGVAEDVISQNAKYNMMKTLELDIRDQLNSKLSPTNNAWRDASQRYGIISRLKDLAEASKNGIRSGSDASFGQLLEEAGRDALVAGAAGTVLGGGLHGTVAGVIGGAAFPFIKRAINRGSGDRALGRVIKLSDKE